MLSLLVNCSSTFPRETLCLQEVGMMYSLKANNTHNIIHIHCTMSYDTNFSLEVNARPVYIRVVKKKLVLTPSYWKYIAICLQNKQVKWYISLYFLCLYQVKIINNNNSRCFKSPVEEGVFCGTLVQCQEARIADKRDYKFSLFIIMFQMQWQFQNWLELIYLQQQTLKFQMEYL